MTTVDDGQTTVTRPRRRPTKTATNARTSRAVFGDSAVKELAIPQFIDIYNHLMTKPTSSAPIIIHSAYTSRTGSRYSIFCWIPQL